MQGKRNIVLITIDSLRADHCSFMGYYRKTTPTIDKMARTGLYFENAIAASVPTMPSMMACFTGEYTLNNAFDFTAENWRKEIASRKTLAQVLQRKGYETVAFHTNPGLSSYYGFNKGFNYFHDFLKDEMIVALTTDSTIKRRFLSIKKILKRESDCMPWEKYYGQIIQRVKELRKLRTPYFLWVLLLDTHTPYYPPRDFRKWSRANFFSLTWQFYRMGKRIGEPKVRNNLINAYDDCILYVDKFIEKISHDLEDDDPIFIIHADHGDGFGEHCFYSHNTPMLYEELIHVPLVIYNADVKGKVEEPVSLLGLAPTILELIGEENEFPSESFLHGGGDWVISKVFDGSKWKIAVRTKEWKFITGQKEKDELYYLKEDPYEQENVINEHPDLAKEMRRIVEIHVKQETEKRRIRERISRLNVRAADNG